MDKKNFTIENKETCISCVEKTLDTIYNSLDTIEVINKEGFIEAIRNKNTRELVEKLEGMLVKLKKEVQLTDLEYSYLTMSMSNTLAELQVLKLNYAKAHDELNSLVNQLFDLVKIQD